ncbi:DUF1707 SHOCT-like domain-containing protein [Actinomadura sp. 3N407]|uniref:DUF1707 SHOCT-like domain-containing protein n=1 Tax=Actinomadura sp. 3N407 TaxID=3457423 RepID=UPI003FCCAD20
MDQQPAHDRIRASDHDRDTTEYGRRLEQALTATTHGDLHRLTADLPAPTRGPGTASAADRTPPNAPQRHRGPERSRKTTRVHRRPSTTLHTLWDTCTSSTWTAPS